MYQLVITPSAKRSLKKLPLAVRQALLAATRVLTDNPFAGEKLSGSLAFLYSFHFKTDNVQYRIAYQVDAEKQLIIIHFAHTRENFYDKVRRLFG